MPALGHTRYTSCPFIASEEFLLNKSQYDASSWTIRSKIWDFVQIFPGGWAMSEAICKLPEKQCPEWESDQSKVWTSQASAWVRIPWKVKVKFLSHVWLFATPWTVAYQSPLSVGFSRQEYWNGLPFPSPGDLPNPGMEPGSPALQTDALPSEPPRKPNVPINIPNWTTGSQDGDL